MFKWGPVSLPLYSLGAGFKAILIAIVSTDYLSFAILLAYLPARDMWANGYEFLDKIEGGRMSEGYIFGHIQKAVSFLLHWFENEPFFPFFLGKLWIF